MPVLLPNPLQSQKVRRRTSYKQFKVIADEFQNRGIAAGLRKLDRLLNHMYAHGSFRQADFAAESLELVIKDLQLEAHITPKTIHELPIN